jgi:surface antigen
MAEMVTPTRRLQCVPYARKLSNIQIRGDAWTWWRQAEGRYARSGAPKAGSVLVLQRKKNGGGLGHVAYVEEVIDSRTITVSHANWLNEGRLHNHTPVRDVSEANDWSEVRFWHTPGRHFGGNVYHPYGFVLPNLTVASR